MRRSIVAKLPAASGPATPDYTTRWVAAHRAHALVGASAFAAFRDSLWGPWRVWCRCGADVEVSSRAAAEMICLVARRGVLRMDVDEWKGNRGDQKAAV